MRVRRFCALWLVGMLLVATAALFRDSVGEPGIQTALRWTARCALILFALTFAASPLLAVLAA